MVLQNSLFCFKFLNILMKFEIIYSATIPVSTNIPNVTVSDIGCNILVIFCLENSNIVTTVNMPKDIKSINAIITNITSKACSTLDDKLFFP